MNAAEQIMPFTTPTADLHNLSHRDSWYPPRQQDPASRVQNVVKPPRFSTPSHSPVNTPLSYLILANQTNTPFPTPHQHPSPHAFPNGIPNGQPFPPTHVLPPQMATQQYPVISPAVPYTGVYPGPDPSSSPYGTWAPPLITTSSSSSSSPWSQSGSIPPTPSTVASSLNSPAVTPTPLASANSSKTKLALVGSPPPSPPPPAYTPTPPEFSRPDLVNSTSAPDVRPPPPPVPVPTRSATAPVPEASSSRSASSSNGQQATDTVRRTRSKKNIVAAAPKDLDKIDELDESDPLGFAWHHGGPYEAIKRSAENGDIERDPKRDALTKMNGQDPTGQQRNRKVKKLTPADMARMLSHFKGVAPGEIFPSFTMYEPYDEPQPSSRFQPPVQPNQPLIRRFTQPEPQSSLSPSYGQDASLPNPYSPAALQTSFDPVPQVDEEDSELPYSQPPPLSNPYDNQPSRYSPQPPQDYSHRPQDVPAPGVVIPPPNGDSNGPVRVHFQEPTLHRPHEMTSGNSSIASSLGDPNRSLNRAHSAPTSRPAARYQQPISESSQQQPQQQQQQQQQIQYQNGIPRPDIPAPARSIMSTNTASSSNGGVPPRHYLPKKLVMPTPLQQQPIAPSNSQNVPSVGGGGPGPYPNPVVLGSGYQGPPKPDAATTVRRAVSASVPGSQKRAQEIPISQGKNLLRKKAGMSTVVASTNVVSAPGSGTAVGGAHIPSSNASAALFASKVTVQHDGGFIGGRVSRIRRRIRRKGRRKRKKGEGEAEREGTGEGEEGE
ncbi:hypothetical protein NLI96_g12858 [Meripilus lineatus]|uniref:Uncharacterized protein n=1 Tax=Meripilus lineatus TaxID=2056292 RepID=A0AAD5UPB7_9APHY|nr:hypothetical protein NLI96_g12858 [Physisporinus lineatus]